MEMDQLPRVRTAAKLINKFIYENKDHLQAGMICAGFDDKERGQVYNITLGGTWEKSKWTSSGSGSSYIYGYCDEHYRENMTLDETVHFIRQALSLAMNRDGYSGGMCRLAVITKNGVERTSYRQNDIPILT